MSDSGTRAVETDVGDAAGLAEGAMRVVEQDGAKVLLARSGGRCHAVGAVCPHAGGPLNEGVLHDGAVLCPWHKAAFRLDTGRCVAPPAVDDLPRYGLRTEAGRLLLGPALSTPAPEAADTDPRVMVILGTGAAGTAAAQALREEGFGGRVLLVGREDRLPYDRTVLSKYDLSGQKGGEKTPLHPAGFYDRQRIERRVADVTEVDPAARRVRFADGASLTYDAALLATGGEPRRLEVPGGDLPGVCVLRTPDDVAAILARAQGARHAVVAGAGFIGMEAAASLRERGLEVTVVAPGAAPLEKQLGPEVGAVFRRVHERAGIAFRLGDEIVAVEGQDQVRSVRLKSGATLPAELVIVGLGVAPATGMLRGLPLREDGGIDTGPDLRIADGLYAAGDIAGVPYGPGGKTIRVEHWRVAMQQGRVAALNMLGTMPGAMPKTMPGAMPKTMPGGGAVFDAVPYFWTIHFKKRLDYVGHAEAWDAVTIDGDLEAPAFLAFYAKAGRVQAVAGWGRDQAMARVIGLMTDRRDWDLPALRAALAAAEQAAGPDGT
ncbi:MAG: FAD-dependent oxidoreductase [Janthinobacterium lividum]